MFSCFQTPILNALVLLIEPHRTQVTVLPDTKAVRDGRRNTGFQLTGTQDLNYRTIKNVKDFMDGFISLLLLLKCHTQQTWLATHTPGFKQHNFTRFHSKGRSDQSQCVCLGILQSTCRQWRITWKPCIEWQQSTTLLLKLHHSFHEQAWDTKRKPSWYLTQTRLANDLFVLFYLLKDDLQLIGVGPFGWLHL